MSYRQPPNGGWQPPQQPPPSTHTHPVALIGAGLGLLMLGSAAIRFFSPEPSAEPSASVTPPPVAATTTAEPSVPLADQPAGTRPLPPWAKLAPFARDNPNASERARFLFVDSEVGGAIRDQHIEGGATASGEQMLTVDVRLPACDDRMLLRVFAHQRGTSFESMFNSMAFQRVTCTAPNGSGRTIDLGRICRCNRADGSCPCLM